MDDRPTLPIMDGDHARQFCPRCLRCGAEAKAAELVCLFRNLDPLNLLFGYYRLVLIPCKATLAGPNKQR